MLSSYRQWMAVLSWFLLCCGLTIATPVFAATSAFDTRQALLSPVAATRGLGVIYRLYYHQPSQKLFFTVYEKNGDRALFSLNRNNIVSRVFTVTTSNTGDIFIDGDLHGNLYFQHNNPQRIYRSADGGLTWKLALENAGIFWAMADDGNGTVYGASHATNTAVLYRSQDDGKTWHEWINFQKRLPQYAVPYAKSYPYYQLRHLHDVVYKDGTLIVGTGDIKRLALISSDNGSHWRTIWDEGFTAHVLTTDQKRLLMCPDQLHRHGIALYDFKQDTTKEVWQPVAHHFSAYCFSLLDMNGIYYAGFHLEPNDAPTLHPYYGIIASPDGEHWYRFVTFGPGDSEEAASVYVEAGKNLLYVNWYGNLYALNPLTKDWFAAHKPFKN